jgi:hypothetical protein
LGLNGVSAILFSVMWSLIALCGPVMFGRSAAALGLARVQDRNASSCRSATIGSATMPAVTNPARP